MQLQRVQRSERNIEEAQGIIDELTRKTQLYLESRNDEEPQTDLNEDA